MERREFLKLTLGFTAAAGGIAATAAQAATMLPQTGDTAPPAGAATAQGSTEPAARSDHNAAEASDADFSAQRRYWRRRWWRPRYYRRRWRPRYYRRWRPRRRWRY
jgi:hypothetical protein